MVVDRSQGKTSKTKNESAVTASSGRTIAADVWFYLCRAHLVQDFQGKCFLRSFPAGTAIRLMMERSKIETGLELLRLSTNLFLVTFGDATLVQALGHWASKLPLRFKKNATCFHSYKKRVDVLTCCIF